MNVNSYICKLIHDNPDSWRDIMYSKAILVKERGDLAIFNYSLMAGPLDPITNTRTTLFPDYADPVVQEARGIIINTKDLEVVCWPFRKFGNHIESYVDEIDWKTAKVQDKLDGSIVKLYFNKDIKEWSWATNGMISAKEANNDMGYNFDRLIKSSVNFENIDFLKLNPNHTYIFELVSPLNTIVVKYPDTRLYHLGTRNNITGKELYEDIGIQKPKEYPLKSMSECLEAVKKLNEGISNTAAKEGFVVVDDNFNRIKIKSPEYLIYHHVVSEPVLKKKDAIDLLLDDNFDIKEFCKSYKKFEPTLKFYDYKIAELFIKSEEMIKYTRNLYEEYSHERKAVAAKIGNHPLAAIGFYCLDNPNVTPKEFYTRDMRTLYNKIPDYENILISEMKKEVPKSKNKIQNKNIPKKSTVMKNDINGGSLHQVSQGIEVKPWAPASSQKKVSKNKENEYER